MDTKLTLSFNAEVIEKAKIYAAQRGMSLSRLVEYLLSQAINEKSSSISEFPIDDWVYMVAEPEVSYVSKHTTNKDIRNMRIKDWLTNKKHSA